MGNSPCLYCERSRNVCQHVCDKYFLRVDFGRVERVIRVMAKQHLRGITLNEMQRTFVMLYLKDPNRNATRAYMAAGYAAKGNVAEVNACNLLKHAGVQAEINKFKDVGLERVRERAGISLERALVSIARTAFYDPRKLFREDGSPKPIDELDDDIAMAIEGVEVVEQYAGIGEDRQFVGYIKKYKLARRSAAQDMLMKHVDGYRADNAGKADSVVDALGALLVSMKRSALPVAQRVDYDEPV